MLVLSKKLETTIVVAQIPPQGLAQEGKKTNLLDMFVDATKKEINELGMTSWNFKSIKLTFSQINTPVEVASLNLIVKRIIEQNGSVLTETFKTTQQGSDNYKLNITSKYELNDGNEYTTELNKYTNNFSIYQLENGNWTLEGEIQYKKDDLTHTDHEFDSNISLPSLGFPYYYGHQIIDMLNTEFKAKALEYVNKIKNFSLTSNQITVEKLLASFETENGEYETGEQIDLKMEVKNRYFYLAITSSIVSGTFYLLVKNAHLSRRKK